MMKKAISIILIFASLISKAQDNEPWIAFWNNDTTLIGFKNAEGEVKIEPKFLDFTSAGKFENIMAVMEDNGGDYLKYYLTKAGKMVGTDSLFIFDNSFDCESEGYIRFQDSVGELVGMFDKNGNVAIPAEYDALSRVENGLIAALKGATKVTLDGHNEIGCNHYIWQGGKKYLLNTNNKILVENFDFDRNLSFYSSKIESRPTKDSIREEFKGLDGRYYTFIDYEKEFKLMMNSFLLSDFTQEHLMTSSYESIYYWKDGEGWISETKEDFIGRNFELIKERLLGLISKDIEYDIMIEGLNPFIYTSDTIEKYFNNCGEAKESKYPVMSLVINSKSGDLAQDYFDFLRTDTGFKLISLTIRTGTIK